jgi:hypothetical protein
VSDLLSPVKQWLKEWLMRRQWAYRTAFSGVCGDLVLKDLMRFCRMHESTFHADPRLHALAEGRREVILRICDHLHLPPEKLWELHSGEDK